MKPRALFKPCSAPTGASDRRNFFREAPHAGTLQLERGFFRGSNQLHQRTIQFVYWYYRDEDGITRNVGKNLGDGCREKVSLELRGSNPRPTGVCEYVSSGSPEGGNPLP